MSDTASPGQRLDAAITAAYTALDELRNTLAAKVTSIGADVNAKIDAVSDRIDEIQAAWEARR
jgi:hypothetical protein